MTISDNGQGYCKSKRSSGPYQSITIETKLDIQSFTKNFVLKNEKKNVKGQSFIQGTSFFAVEYFKSSATALKLNEIIEYHPQIYVKL